MKTRLVFYENGSVALFERKDEGLKLLKTFSGKNAHERAVGETLGDEKSRRKKVRTNMKYTDHVVREKAKELRQAREDNKKLTAKIEELRKALEDCESMLTDSIKKRQELADEIEIRVKMDEGKEKQYKDIVDDRNRYKTMLEEEQKRYKKAVSDCDHWHTRFKEEQKRYKKAVSDCDHWHTRFKEATKGSADDETLEELLAEAQNQIEEEKAKCSQKVKELEEKLAQAKKCDDKRQPEEITMTNAVMLSLLRELRECAIDMREKIQDAHEKIVSKKKRKF